MKKICEKCGKEYETRKSTQRFCSKSCVHKGKTINKETREKISKAMSYNLKHNEKLRETLKEKVWNNKELNAKASQRMKTGNPMNDLDCRDKMKSTMKTKHLPNNFNNCGNGKISYVESLLLEYLQELGFEYNKTIITRSVRELYPEANYAYCYKPDFVREDLKLCIEIDGSNHRKTKDIERDKKKEKCLNQLGYKIIRFSNEEVLNSKDSVVNSIKEVIEGYGKTN